MKKYVILGAVICLLGMSAQAEAHDGRRQHPPQRNVTVLHQSPALTVRHIQYSWPPFPSAPVTVVHWNAPPHGHGNNHWNKPGYRPVVWHAPHRHHRGWHYCPR